MINTYRTRIPLKNYLKGVQELCKKHNVLFICDEIQTGYGRTGTDLAFQAEPDIRPDLVTLRKAVTGGKNKLWDSQLGAYEVSGTYAGGPVQSAAALATLDVLEQGNYAARAQHLRELLARIIDDLTSPHVIEHRGRGRGLFQALILDESVPGLTTRRVAALAAQRGVIVGSAPTRLRFSSPLTIREEDLVKGVTIVMQALKDVTQLDQFPGSDYIN